MDDRPAEPQLIVIGTSEGGLDALSRLVAEIPSPFPAPILIAQHLDPNRESHLHELLARGSTLPVRPVVAEATLEPGVIFVVPANRHAEIVDGTVRVRSGHGERPMPSIDLLFSTAASVYQENLIAIILTGSGSDGAAGARDVKASGGTVIIQSPETANNASMPLSLAPTTVDIVADLESIGQLLHDLLTGKHVVPPPDEDAQVSALLGHLRERSGVDFTSYKAPTIMRRLQRRMAATGASTVMEYDRHLQRNPDEYARLINSFLINVTEFFRDEEAFNYLRERVLPELIDAARDRGELRVWSAGCATGEEAYSLGLLVAELLGDELEDLAVRIFATDLDADAIAFARRGIYPSSALSNVPRGLLDRYFDKIDDGWQASKDLRSMTVFGQHDLGQRAPFPRIDLTLCRNVLIYFTPELQKRALQLFAFSLRDRGYLMLGKSETVSPLPDYFAIEHARLKVYRRVGEHLLIPPAAIRSARPIAPLRVVLPSSAASSVTSPRSLRDQTAIVSVVKAETILTRLPTGVVVVDRRYDIRFINLAARRLLGIRSPAVGEDLIHAARHLSDAPLRASIDAAFQGEFRSIVTDIDVDTADRRYLEMSFYPEPSGSPGGQVDAVTIQVVDVTRAQLDRLAVEDATTRLERMRQLNRDVTAANEELIEANAELSVANEEFLVANEEVQAATEEVETLNEELQATNEELETLNEELQATVEELNATNDDLEARSFELQDMTMTLEQQRRESESQRNWLETVLNNLGDAVLVVDEHGQRVLANPAFAEMFGGRGERFEPEDERGAPIVGDHMLQRRVVSGESFTTQFTLAGGDAPRYFEATGEPVIASGGERWGVLVIRDITDRSLRRLQDQFLALASHELRTPLTVLNGSLQLLARSLGHAIDERQRRYIERSIQYAGRLSFLIDDLLDVARLQTGKFNVAPEAVNLNDLVTRTTESATALTEKQTIEVDIPDEPIEIAVDPDRIQQALLNLISNAIIHAPDSRRVDVRLRRVDSVVELQVQDYGRGIPEADRERVFSRFLQLEQPTSPRRRAGLGLGLYIAREIVEAHRGTITVDSIEGEGATFIMRLPID